MMPPTELWFAVQTRPLSEKMVLALLKYKGYEVFLPAIRPPFGASRRTLEQPLFPGYLFCQACSSAQGLIVTTPGVIRLLGVGTRPVPIDQVEIENLQSLQKSGLPLRPWPTFECGHEIEIVRGPLTGCRGVVRQWRGRDHLVVVVTLLQRAVAVEVNAAWICERIGFPPARITPQHVTQSTWLANTAS
jgi:transcription termination/antitermination protein NusG